MCRYYSLGLVIFLFFSSDELQAEHLRVEYHYIKPIIFVWNFIKQHPFLTAAILVLSVQKEPWECIKGTINYYIEEHPILCVIVLGLLVSGTYKQFCDCAKIVGTVTTYIFSINARFIRFIEKKFLASRSLCG
ncbi:hypothetical protein E3J79_00915 [Candidatus Dependentiae bacterium]|nr:MAG: hypothetical protein E3J79_00915 [Candidatus Dependentiae bacterium]